jgi:glyoxylase-like metal-dependent hydrolase (beta-lactamase superfamily II)
MRDEHASALDARGNHYRQLVPELPAKFNRLLDGDEIRMGGADWRVVEGHGHSPEHAALYAAKLGLLISGDMLLPRISTNVSVWPAEADGNPLKRFLDSLSIYESLPADTLVLPSHGMPFRGIALRVAQLRAHHATRLDELVAATDAPGPAGVTASDLVPVLFRRELDLQQRFFAIGEAIAHLNYLWREGRLERRAGGNGTIRFARPRA